MGMAVPAARLLEGCFVGLGGLRGGRKSGGQLAVSSRGRCSPLPPFSITGQSNYFCSVLFSEEGQLLAMLVCSHSAFIRTSPASGTCLGGCHSSRREAHMKRPLIKSGSIQFMYLFAYSLYSWGCALWIGKYLRVWAGHPPKQGLLQGNRP